MWWEREAEGLGALKGPSGEEVGDGYLHRGLSSTASANDPDVAGTSINFVTQFLLNFAD